MHATDIIALFSGLVVGVSLGLTGGGGSIFAVPLLVYALGLAPTDAIGLSLGIVGLTAGSGAALRLGKAEIDWTSGLVFAAAAMALAPAGAWYGHQLPPAVLLSGFALLMLVVGTQMWRGRGAATPVARPHSVDVGWRRHFRLLAAGSVAGVLSGLFGVGGGFIIVPALLYATGMSVHRAIATSLLVILLISLAGMWFVAAFMLAKNVPALLAAAPRPGAAGWSFCRSTTTRSIHDVPPVLCPLESE